MVGAIMMQAEGVTHRMYALLGKYLYFQRTWYVFGFKVCGNDDVGGLSDTYHNAWSAHSSHVLT